jgi:hypothetical protein
VPFAQDGPIITDNPIWLAETSHVAAIALPEESPQAVLDLAHRFGSKVLVIVGIGTESEWPGILGDGSTASSCFRESSLTDTYGSTPDEDFLLSGIHVFLIACP